jgi:hypothetical protein
LENVNNTLTPASSLMRALAAMLVSLEALLLAIVAAGYTFYAVAANGSDITPVVVLAIFTLVLAGGVGAAGVGLWRGKRWARSLALVWQALQIAVGAAYWVPQRALAVTLIGAAVLVILLLGRALIDAK